MAERDLVVRIIGDEKDLLRAFGSSTRGVRNFETQMTGVSRTLRNVFAAAGVALGAAAIVRAVRSTIDAAISFESSFAGVRKTVDATEPQLKALAEGFRGLSREIPISVEELNRIGEAAGQLGIQRTAILDFTETIAALGVTTNLASQEAADALARIANITQLPQDEFDRLGSTVVDLGNKLAATESEIVDFGLRIAAAGKIVGLTVDETLAIAGAFTSVGVEAEAGGTAVSKVFISLANAVRSGGEQLELFAKTAGTSTAEFRRQFETNTSAAFVAFVEGLKRVDAEGGNVFRTLKDLGLTDVRLVRAFLSISQSGDLLSRSLAVGSRAWDENSALQIEAAKRYETTASKLQIFQNRVNDLQITLGNVLAPALLQIIEPLGEWLEQTENQERVQRALIETMDDARAVFEGIRAVVQPLAEATKDLADRMGGLRNAVELLLVAMVAAKIVAFGTAITGLGTTALVATGRVSALRLALLRLGAIGVITLGVELVLNRKEIEGKAEELHRAFRDRFGGLAGGTKLDLPVDITVENLIELRNTYARIKGEGSLAVKTLDEIIRKKRIIDSSGPRPAREDAGIRIHGAERETKRLEKDLDRVGKTRERLVEQFAARMARLGLELDKAGLTKSLEDDLRVLAQQEALVRAQISAEGSTLALERQLFEIERQRLQIREQQGDQARSAKEALKQRIAEQREIERLQREAQRQARIGRQFEALGLTAEGQARVPGAGALRRRLASLTEQIRGTALDTDKTRTQLARIAKVLSGQFGALGRDVRASILQMFSDIANALNEGDKQGPLTKFQKTGIGKLIEGLGLSEEEIKALRQRLSQLGPGGTIPTAGVSAFGFAVPTTTTGGGGGNIIINGNIEVQARDADAFIREVQKRAGRSAGSRRGVRAGSNRGMG
jgi:TP901 family phage tail tape measure protein